MIDQKDKNIVTAPDASVPTEIAAKSLTQADIENLLQEKFDNMYLYTHYDIFGETNLHPRICIGESFLYGQTAKNSLERKMPQIELVVSATKVIKIQKPEGSYSGQYMGNLIFRDKITGKFHALNDWTYLKFEDTLLTHTGNGADLDKYSLLTLFSQLSKTARVKSDDKLMQTVLFHKIYEALSQARGLSR